MIKRYQQCVEGKVNEDVYMASPQTAPTPTETPTETPTRPRPTAPGIVPTEIPAEQDAPLAQYGEEEEEEGGQYIGQKMMAELAEKLGAEVVDGAIEYNGQKVNFYSETEMFHIGKKKFKTTDQVVTYLEANEPAKVEAEKEGEIIPEFESKSYKFTRKLKPSKRK
jgi:hypothetical protein